MDNAIDFSNAYPYPLDSAIQLLNNRGLISMGLGWLHHLDFTAHSPTNFIGSQKLVSYVSRVNLLTYRSRALGSTCYQRPGTDSGKTRWLSPLPVYCCVPYYLREGRVRQSKYDTVKAINWTGTAAGGSDYTYCLAAV